MVQLKCWPEHERPREKLVQLGASALSDAELLAIFLRTGICGKNVIELAREAIHHFGGLKQLMAADLSQFSSIKGLGKAKYVQLQASIEMSQRYLAEIIKEQDVFQSPSEVKRYIQGKLVQEKSEVFAAVFLDNQHRVIAFESLFRGTINSAMVYPRVVVQKALQYNAAAVVVCHNHPSGVAEASLSDQTITKTLKQALGLVDIRLLDHFIVASHQVLSMAEMGLV